MDDQIVIPWHDLYMDYVDGLNNPDESVGFANWQEANEARIVAEWSTRPELPKNKYAGWDTRTFWWYEVNKDDLLPPVLDMANDIRHAMMIGEGKMPELPQGEPGDARHCVLAVALSNGWSSKVDSDGVELTHRTEGYVTPEYDFEQRRKVEDIPDLDKLLGSLETLGYKAYGEHIEMGSYVSTFVKIDMPTAFDRFITWYDSNYYPHLILGHEDDNDDSDDNS